VSWKREECFTRKKGGLCDWRKEKKGADVSLYFGGKLKIEGKSCLFLQPAPIEGEAEPRVAVPTIRGKIRPTKRRKKGKGREGGVVLSSCPPAIGGRRENQALLLHDLNLK